MNWLTQGGAHVLFHQIFSLLWRAGWLVVNYFVKMISRSAESSICWSFLLCQQLTQMNLANRMLSRDDFALNPQVQHTAAPAAQRPVEGARSGTQLCSSAGWVHRHVEYSRQRSGPIQTSLSGLFCSALGWLWQVSRLYRHLWVFIRFWLCDICKVVFSNFMFLFTPKTSAHVPKKQFQIHKPKLSTCFLHKESRKKTSFGQFCMCVSGGRTLLLQSVLHKARLNGAADRRRPRVLINPQVWSQRPENRKPLSLPQMARFWWRI